MVFALKKLVYYIDEILANYFDFLCSKSTKSYTILNVQ